ncbi:MAG: hypothetical protein WDW38_002504 [Sanguina aurantia]
MPTPDETALNGLEEEQDELEALLESYTRQAEAECAASGAAATAARSTAVRGRSRSGGSRGGGTAAATGRGGGASRGSGGSKSMEAAREEGLARPLGSDNRGYRMLLKMGYSQGSALGGPQKSGSASTGLSEPIRVELKSGRAGLGVQEQQKRRRVELQERQAVVMQDRAQASLLQAESYQHSQQDAFSHRQQLRQLGGVHGVLRGSWIGRLELRPVQASLHSCRTWRCKKERAWARRATARLPNSSSDNHKTPTHQLAFHRNCDPRPWQQSPLGGGGVTRARSVREHGVPPLRSDDVAGTADGSLQDSSGDPSAGVGLHPHLSESVLAQTAQVLPSTAEQLGTALHYLRQTHTYCCYCGCCYDTQQELAGLCPGVSEDLH